MPTDRDLALVKAALEAAARYLQRWGGTGLLVEDVLGLDPAAIVASQHICLVCGRTEPCTETPDACTFDPTPQELYQENIRLCRRVKELEAETCELCDGSLAAGVVCVACYNQLRRRTAELEAELAGKRQSPITYPSTDQKEPK